MNSFDLFHLAQGQTAPQGNALMSFLPFILLMVGFYFLLIRPQQKKQKEHAAMVTALKPGDHVVTAGGICGTVTLVRKDRVQLKVDDTTRIEVIKSSIQSMDKKDD